MQNQKWVIYFLLIIIGFFVFMIGSIVYHQSFNGPDIRFMVSENI